MIPSLLRSFCTSCSFGLACSSLCFLLSQHLLIPLQPDTLPISFGALFGMRNPLINVYPYYFFFLTSCLNHPPVSSKRVSCSLLQPRSQCSEDAPEIVVKERRDGRMSPCNNVILARCSAICFLEENKRESCSCAGDGKAPSGKALSPVSGQIPGQYW